MNRTRRKRIERLANELLNSNLDNQETSTSSNEETKEPKQNSIDEDSSGKKVRFSVGNKKTPVTGLPNRANEKQTSGSVLPSISGNSSSNRAASKEANTKILNRTKSAKRKLKKFSNKDYKVSIENLNKTLSGLGKLLSLDTRGSSRYGVLLTDGGKTVAIRLSDHVANGNNFEQDGADRNISIVIERRVYDEIESGVEFTEVTIPMSVYEKNGKGVVDAIVKGVEAVLADKSFELDECLGTVITKGGEKPSVQFQAAERGLDADSLALDAVMECLKRGGIDVITVSREQAISKAGEEGVNLLETENGTVYGWTENGKIYLAPDGMNAETPIHEYTHLWATAMQISSPKTWKGIVKILKESPMWSAVEADPLYANIRMNENEVASEVLSRLSGKKGRELFEAEMRKVNERGNNLIESARVSVIIDNVRKAVREFWSWVGKNLFGIKRFNNLNEITDRVLYDLTRGTKLDKGDKDKTLIGVHNISVDKLLKAIKMGGLANPSVAVIDVERQIHDGYGEISLVMPSEKLNKGKNGSGGTYTGDAWTPMYPNVERVFKGNGSRMMFNDIAKLPKEMQSAARDGLRRWMDGHTAVDMSYWFLHEKGIAPELVYMHSSMPRELIESVLSVGAKNINGEKYIERSLDELTDKEYAELEQQYVNTLFQGDRKKYEWVVDNHRRLLEKRSMEKGIFGDASRQQLEMLNRGRFYKLSAWVKRVIDDYNQEGRFDLSATERVAQAIIYDNPKLLKEFESWLESLTKRYELKEVLFNGFTPIGNRRYLPHTLENVSRLMRQQGKTGTSVWANKSSYAMSPLSTTDKVVAEQERLVNDHEELKRFDNQIMETYYLLSEVCGKGDWSAGEARLNEALSSTNPAMLLRREYDVELTPEQAEMLNEMQRKMRKDRPAMYFETKFERPVRFGEFAAAVVPEGTPADVVEFLRGEGLRIETYDPNDETSRRDAMQRATKEDGIRFRMENKKATESEGARFSVDNKKTGKSKTQSGRPTWRDAVRALSDSRSRTQKGTALWTRSQSDDAKVQKILIRLNNLEETISDSGMGPNGFNAALSTALKGEDETSGTTTYKKVDIRNTPTTIRIGNHYATVTNFQTLNNAGIVIKTSDAYFRPKNTVDYLEFAYFGDELSGNAELQRRITSGLRHYIETGSFEKMPKPNTLNASGWYREIMKDLGIDYKLSELAEEKEIEINSKESESELLHRDTEEINDRFNADIERFENHKFTADIIMQTRAKEIADRLGVGVRILSDTAEINSLSSARKRRAKGWYDSKTDEVVIIAPNNRDIADIEATIAHEVIAHQGLRRLIGKERFDTFLNEIYDRASQRIKSAIDRRAEQERQRYIEAETARLGGGILARAEATSKATEKADNFRRTATEEYMAEMAERISVRGFERMSREEQSLWGHIKERVTRIINAIKEISGISTSTELTDKDIADILYRSYKNLTDGDGGGGRKSIFDIAEEIAMRESTRYNSEKSNNNLNYSVESNLKSEKIEKLRNSNPVILDDSMIPSNIDLRDRKEIQSYLKENYRGNYVNKDTKEIITISNLGIKEVTSHSMTDMAHIKSMFAIPEMIENAIYIDSRNNEKDHDKFSRYDYYACGLKIDGVDYTANKTNCKMVG